jgi:hypothetical protein
MNCLATDEDLARARTDPEFRHQLMADNLDMLVSALNAIRRANDKSAQATRQMREGTELALKLADRLHGNPGPKAA